MQFQFQSSRKSFEIKDVKGEVLKTYYIDIGQIDKFKEIMKHFSLMKEEIDRIDNEGMTEAIIDNIVGWQKQIVDTLLDNDFDVLWEECGKNVFAMLDLVQALITLVNGAMSERK